MKRLAALAVAMLLLWAGAVRAADTVYYYSSDTIHSEVVVTDQNRNVVERTYYAPYGAVLNRDRRDGPGYTGHEEDPETNLVYMQQRYYDPEAGRFLSTDPVQADGNGGSFNRYAYAADNPYRYYDPDGRMKDQDQERSPGCTGSLTRGGCGAVNMSTFVVDDSYRRGNAEARQTTPQHATHLIYKHGVPPASPAVDRMLECTAECMGENIRVTSTSDSHGPHDVHTRGLAADVTTRNPRELMQCAANCGARFQLNEYVHPSPNATGGHVHLQLVPGRRGATGPYYPQPPPASGNQSPPPENQGS